MELNSKVQELENEVKILKAEIRNVLLDIREVILERSNPLADEQQPAYVRMDLNTTARALAAEVGAREAVRAAEAEAAEAAPAQAAPAKEEEEEEADEAKADSHGDEKASSDDKTSPEGESEGEDPPAVEATNQPAKGKGRKRKATKTSPSKVETAEPRVERAAIPAMFRASPSAASLASWVIEAVREIGPEKVDRVITIHRLCGTIPTNLSEALAHVQELIRSSNETEPSWLRVLEELEDLA